MVARLTTLQDIVDASDGALIVETNASDLTLPINEIRLLIYAPHAAPENFDEIDPAEVASQLPSEGHEQLQEFLRRDPAAQEFLRYGWYRADGGAREIADETLVQAGTQGQYGVVIRPRWFGRGVLELNRDTGVAIGDGYFKVPGALQNPLQAIHRNSTDTLWALADQLFAGGKLEGVFQPHTMSSGNPTDEEMTEITRLVSELPEYAGTDAALFKDPEKTAALLAYWRKVYDTMNGRRDRKNVDVILNQHQKPSVCIGDPRVATHFLNSLQAQDIPAAFDDPFGHMPTYPGSRLSVRAVAAKISELIFDAPRHELLMSKNSSYPLTGFRPDPQRIQIFASTALDSLQRR